MLGRYVKGDEAAAFLGVDRRRLFKLEGLPRCVLGPRTIRFDMEDLRLYRPRVPPPTTAEGLAELMSGRIAEKPAEGRIYFMRCRDIVKMGWSANPDKRLRQLRRFIPFYLEMIGHVPGAIAAEKELHASLRPLRAGHLEEWYREDPFLRAAHLVIEAIHG